MTFTQNTTMVSTTQAVGAVMAMQPADTYEAGKQGTSEPRRTRGLSDEELGAAVKELNAAMKVVNTSLSFSIDSVTKKTIVTVTDEQTHEVIRQIPSEEMLRVSQRITELLGILFDHAG